MTRREFPKSIKVTVIKRCTRGGVTYCEICGAIAKRWQIDHIRADGLLGEPTLENAMLICEPCYMEKNKADTSHIARAKRIEARDLGIRPPPAQKIQSRGFPKRARPSKIGKAKIEKQPMPRKEIYE